MILSETLESYAPEIVVELKSDGADGELEENVARIERWVEEWKRNGGGAVGAAGEGAGAEEEGEGSSSGEDGVAGRA